MSKKKAFGLKITAKTPELELETAKALREFMVTLAEATGAQDDLDLTDMDAKIKQREAELKLPKHSIKQDKKGVK